MKILVIGGTGLTGSEVVKILDVHGHSTASVTPGNGINVMTGEGLAEAMQDAEVVIDLSNPLSAEGEDAISFFSTAGRHLLVAAINARVKHYVALSVTGIDQMLDMDYMYAKKIQEDFIRISGVPYTIIRCTQFHDFMPGMSSAISAYIDGVVSNMVFQPIATRNVAGFVAMVAGSKPLNGITEIAGPECKQIVGCLQDYRDETVPERNNNPGGNNHYFHLMEQEMEFVL